MNRRAFICSTGATAMGPLLPALAVTEAEAVALEPFEWTTPDLTFSFSFSAGKLRQKFLLPAGYPKTTPQPRRLPGRDCDPLQRRRLAGSRHETGNGPAWGAPGFCGQERGDGRQGPAPHAYTLRPGDETSGESFYEAFDGVPVVRRWTRATNGGSANAGIEFLSSAMLHGLGDGQRFDRELKIHLAVNSWMSEAQWHAFRPSELGFVENERTSWSQASAGSIGSWSTEKYLPMAMVENTRLGLTWFWQIEHNGSWYWEISNNAAVGQRADDVYAWLGGPDDLHSAAWKNLAPGASYRSVPVAVGCVAGGFTEAVAALTAYRRAACLLPHPDNKRCSVIFNDYMNCLWADPTEENELR